MSEQKNASVEDIQKNLLCILKMIKKVFDEHDIPYFLSYGTLLGGVRHKGFIPWDDDIDLCVNKKSYEKAMQLLREKLPDYIIVHDKKSNPKYWLPYSQIVYKHSSSINIEWPENNDHPYTGIGIDIFRFWEEKKYSNKTAKIVSTSIFLQNLVTNATAYKGLGKILRIFKYSLLLVLYKAQHLFALKSRMYCMDPVMLSKPIMPEDIEAAVFMEFEEVKCSVPKGFDRILKNEYGNYMELPPVEERESHYSVVNIDKNIYEMIDYENYI